jgi:tRNA A-37 threonylcarbamoyl transferase component Bud32
MYKQAILIKYEKDPDHVLREIGHGIARLHNTDIIHGDLTTSNIMIKFK